MERFTMKLQVEGNTHKGDELKAEIDDLMAHINDTFVSMAQLDIIQETVVDFEADAIPADEDMPFSEEMSDVFEELGMAEQFERVVEMVGIQKDLMQQETIFDEREYSRGQYNGMEAILAILENREPVYLPKQDE